jgi:hypothetical protein
MSEILDVHQIERLNTRRWEMAIEEFLDRINVYVFEA